MGTICLDVSTARVLTVFHSLVGKFFFVGLLFPRSCICPISLIVVFLILVAVSEEIFAVFISDSVATTTYLFDSHIF